MPSTPTCADVIAQTMRDAGIRHIFGHPGGEVVEFMDTLASHGIEFILTGHESTAAFMAGAVGRLTGIPGACLATLGPGACNLVLGAACAYLDRDPLLAFSARTASGRIHISHKQNIPLNDMFASITKWSVALNGGGTQQTIHAAITVATTPPAGPVYLSLPSDVATGPDRPQAARPVPPDTSRYNDEAFDTIVDALNNARRPIGVVGIALNPERDAPVVRRFFEETGMPYVDTPQSKGVADEYGDRFLGAVSPGAGERRLIERLKASDCLLGTGFDPVESAQRWHIDAPFYAIANGPIDFDAYHPPACCIGDVGGLLDRLRAAYRGAMDWTDAEIRAIRQAVDDAIRPEEESGPNGLAPYHLITRLRGMLPEDTIVTADVGAHKNVMVQAWRAPAPGTFLISNGLSAMGHAVGAAMGAALLRPEQPVVCVTGDGAFGMMVQELETVRRMGIAPLFIVLCDRSLAVIKMAQKIRDLPLRGVNFAPVDWVRVAEGFGVRAEATGTMDDVGRAVTGWLARREAMVLAVRIDETLYKGIRY